MGLINGSRGSKSNSYLRGFIVIAVEEKRAGCMRSIVSCEASKRHHTDRIELLNATEDVYLDKDTTIA